MSAPPAKRARASHCFDAVVVTACHERQCIAIRDELARRPAFQGLVALAVSDPHSRRVGSGGGTINALVEVAEELTLRSTGKRQPIDFGVLNRSKVCIIHSGGDSQRSPTQSVCGKAWSSLNSLSEDGELQAPFDLLYSKLCEIFASAPTGGCVVASCDVMLLLDSGGLDWSTPGVCGLAIPADLSIGPNHGVFVLEPGSTRIAKYIQKGSVLALRKAGAVSAAEATGQELVNIDSGVLHFDAEATRAILALAEQEPFVGCTRAGSEAFRVELYSDVMLAFAGGAGSTREDYLAMPPSDADAARSRQARELLWDALHCMQMHASVPSNASAFGHLGTTRELHDMLVARDGRFKEAFGLRPLAHAHVSNTLSSRKGVCINSILMCGPEALLETSAVVEHSELHGQWRVGQAAIVSGVRLGRHFAGNSSGSGSFAGRHLWRVRDLCWRRRICDGMLPRRRSSEEALARTICLVRWQTVAGSAGGDWRHTGAAVARCRGSGSQPVVGVHVFGVRCRGAWGRGRAQPVAAERQRPRPCGGPPALARIAALVFSANSGVQRSHRRVELAL